MPLTPTLLDVLKTHGDSIKDDLRKVLPGTVIAVHADTQKIDVQIAIDNPLFDQFNNVEFESLPSLKDVPLATLRGGKFFVWMPVEVGDSVLLLFSDLAMDTWLASTPGGDSVQPAWVGKHTSASPVAIPCIAPDSAKFDDIDALKGKLVIGKDGAVGQIIVDGTEIDFGHTTTSFIALADGLKAQLDLIKTALDTVAFALNAQGAIFSALPVVPINTSSLGGLLTVLGGAIKIATDLVDAGATTNYPLLTSTLVKSK